MSRPAAEPDDGVGRYLRKVLEDCGEDTSGHMAQELPELRGDDPVRHALALVTAGGTERSAGDDEHVFTIQSISKPLVYALAIDDVGPDRVRETVGMEPSGEAFNELSLEGQTGRPLNSMINAGAIATHQLVDSSGYEPLREGPERAARTDEVRRRTARIVAGLSAFAGRELRIDWQTADSMSHRNLAIAHMLKTHGVLEIEPEEAVLGYNEQCSVRVTVQDIARMAAVLANNGLHPETGDRVISESAARQTLSVMATCGMYDASGRWLARIGIPAKSGISGGIIGVLPGQIGVASFAPHLDEAGNSAQGVEMFERLSQDLGLHLMVSERRDIAGYLRSFGG